MCAGSAGPGRPRCHSWTLPSARRGACLALEAGRGRLPGQGRWFELLRIRGEFDGADGTPGTIRSGGMSKSVAKAPRVGIGREKKRGISTILLARPGAIGAFATDLDNRRRRGLREGRPWAGRKPRQAPRRPRGPRGRLPGPRGRAPAPPARRGSPVDAPRRARSSLDPRARHLTREIVG